MISETKIEVYCKGCKIKLPQDHDGPCPECGEEGRHIKAEGSDVMKIAESTSWAHKREFLEKRPGLYAVIVIITIGLPILGYFISGFIGLIIAVALGTFAFFMGPKAVKKIKKTTIGGSQ